MAEEVDSLIDESLKELFPDQGFRGKLTKGFSTLWGQPTLPKKDESAVIALDNPKTAALCYDRVWRFPGDDTPEEIGFGGTTRLEVEMLIPFYLAIYFSRVVEKTANEESRNSLHGIQFGLTIKFLVKLIEATSSSETMNLIGPEFFSDFFVERRKNGPRKEKTFPPILEEVYTRILSENINRSENLSTVPFYGSCEARNRQFREGNRIVLTYVLKNLELVDETELSWGQVLEFRKDREARRVYRRLLHWLDEYMVNRSQAFIEDEIGQRLERYQWALKKHGLKALLGSFSVALDPKTIMGATAVGTGAGLATNSLWVGLLAGGVLPIGNIIIEMAKWAIDLHDTKLGPNSDIAYVHEIKRKLGKGNS